MEQARYHQPRWMNAIVIVWCSLVIAGWALLPKQDAQILAFVGVPAMLIFVAIVNKVRAGVFAPRWDELRQIKAAQQRSRFEQLFIALLVMIAAPFTAGLLAWSLGNYLDPTSPGVVGLSGLAGLVCGLVFAIVNVFRVLRQTAQS
jgi:hypothetical protein